MRTSFCLAVAIGLTSLPPPAWATQRVEIDLVLAVDLSGSVDGAEQALQRGGLVAAFRDAVVVDALGALTGGAAMALVERDKAVAAGVTINGLAILNEEPYLDEYYRRTVIGGPGAFVMSIADYGDFAEAIRRKLLRELMPGPTASR